MTASFFVMSKRILFIGPAGDNGALYHGASAKNSLIIRRLVELGASVTVVDTENKLKSFIPLAFHSLFINYDEVIISASRRSAYSFIRLFRKLHPRRSLHYWMIGGILAEEIESGRFSRKVLSGLTSIITEALPITRKLNEAGLDNVVTIPNFRDISLMPGDIRKGNDMTVKFIFMSRIDPVKGTDIIFKAVEKLEKRGLTDFIIDFYGVVKESYRNEFEKRLAGSSRCRFKGFLDLSAKEGYSILASYNCMIFPTVWESEGIAGIFIDAAMAGLPVIASDWRYNSEFITHLENGLMVRPDSADSLADAMALVIKERSLLDIMSEKSREKAALYDYRRLISPTLIPFEI